MTIALLSMFVFQLIKFNIYYKFFNSANLHVTIILLSHVQHMLLLSSVLKNNHICYKFTYYTKFITLDYIIHSYKFT